MKQFTDEEIRRLIPEERWYSYFKYCFENNDHSSGEEYLARNVLELRAELERVKEENENLIEKINEWKDSKEPTDE